MTPTPYDNYKDSGIDWLGPIPGHWEIKRIKNIIASIQGGGTPKTDKSEYWDGPIPWVSPKDMKFDHIRTSIDSITEAAVKDSSTSLIKEGLILMVVRSGILKHTLPLAINKVPVAINQDIKALKPVKDIYSNYLFWGLKGYAKNILNICYKVGATVESIELGYFINFPLPHPPLTEQTAIANYLDQQTAAIDKKTVLLQQRIVTYQALRKSIINETVCRGLDKTALLKDSGIEWIGKIPAHWAVKRLNDIAQINANALSETTSPTYSFKYVDIGNVGVSGIISDPEKITFSEAPSRARRIVRKNDIILSTVRTYLKAVASFNQDIKDVIVSTGFAVLTPARHISPVFLAYLVRSDGFIDNIARHSTGVSYPAINSSTVSTLPIIYPPLAEQTAIANYLDEKTATIDAIIANLNAQLTTLAELRKTLINDVVTGRIRVA